MALLVETEREVVAALVVAVLEAWVELRAR